MRGTARSTGGHGVPCPYDGGVWAQACRALRRGRLGAGVPCDTIGAEQRARRAVPLRWGRLGREGCRAPTMGAVGARGVPCYDEGD
jgi:hypothetical protein